MSSIHETIPPMNKANKNAASIKSLWNYLNSDRKWLVPNRERTRKVKRTITRMTRRVNKALCVMQDF